jgi:hypothetical protein
MSILQMPSSIVAPGAIIVPREEITDTRFGEIFKTEPHVRHRVVRYADSNHLYWEKHPPVILLMQAEGGISFEEMLDAMIKQGHNKNSEIYRKLYRDAGCSLYDYYETFYIPNDSYYPSEYVPGKK